MLEFKTEMREIKSGKDKLFIMRCRDTTEPKVQVKGYFYEFNTTFIAMYKAEGQDLIPIG